MQDGATPSLDMRDVNDAYSHRQHSGHPDKSRIRGFIHDDTCTYPHRSLNFRNAGSNTINSRSLRPREVSRIRDCFMLLPFSKWTSPLAIASSQTDRCGQLRRQASASA